MWFYNAKCGFQVLGESVHQKGWTCEAYSGKLDDMVSFRKNDYEMAKKEKNGAQLPDFGAFLKRLRGDLTIAEIADATGKATTAGSIGANTLGHWEAGRIADPDPAVLVKLADVYKAKTSLLRLLWELVREKYIASTKQSARRSNLIEAAFCVATPSNGLKQFAEDVFRAKRKMLADVNVVDVDGIAAITKSLPNLKECWVVARDLADDNTPLLLDAIVERLNKDKTTFVYFIPPDRTAQFLRLKYQLIAPPLKDKEQLDTLVRGYRLVDETAPWLQTDYSVFNPQKALPDFGFQFRRLRGRPHLGLQIDPFDLKELINTLFKWKEEHEDRLIKRQE